MSDIAQQELLNFLVSFATQDSSWDCSPISNNLIPITQMDNNQQRRPQIPINLFLRKPLQPQLLLQQPRHNHSRNLKTLLGRVQIWVLINLTREYFLSRVKNKPQH
uniref:Uncharacterized protein n=1 Tax=Opuntia streptacantha TaxID=393608 RepID=A0A7C8ZTB6_OPUST